MKSASKRSTAKPETAPHLALIGEEMVTDARTGLTWSRANVPGGRMSWKDAKAACAALELGGHKDWCLPTRAELLTLVDDTRFDPAIDPVFSCDPSWYWTSTPAASSPAGCAWCVAFYYGSSDWYHQDSECFVRAVRPSQ